MDIASFKKNEIEGNIWEGHDWKHETIVDISGWVRWAILTVPRLPKKIHSPWLEHSCASSTARQPQKNLFAYGTSSFEVESRRKNLKNIWGVEWGELLFWVWKRCSTVGRIFQGSSSNFAEKLKTVHLAQRTK